MEAVRTGFSSVMPLSNLQLFYANEMKILLCGTGTFLNRPKSSPPHLYFITSHLPHLRISKYISLT